MTRKLLLTVANKFQARMPGYHLFSVPEGGTADCYKHFARTPHTGWSLGLPSVYETPSHYSDMVLFYYIFTAYITHKQSRYFNITTSVLPIEWE